MSCWRRTRKAASHVKTDRPRLASVDRTPGEGFLARRRPWSDLSDARRSRCARIDKRATLSPASHLFGVIRGVLSPHAFACQDGTTGVATAGTPRITGARPLVSWRQDETTVPLVEGQTAAEAAFSPGGSVYR